MSRRLLFLSLLPLSILAPAAVGCLSEGGTQPGASSTADGGTSGGGSTNPITTPDATTVETDAAVEDPTTNDAIKDSTQPFLTYLDDLTKHPGCSQADMASRTDGVGQAIPEYTPAVLPDFPCAARELTPSGTEDTAKPVIILVHGNSSSPYEWENIPAIDGNTPIKMLTNTLVDDGYHVYEADLRVDKAYSATNPAKNVDHGWAVPIVQALVKSVHAKYPTRKINMAGFSLGPTIIRDALRRLHHNGEKPFSYIHALHLVSGANHGVSTFPVLCGDISNPVYPNRVGWAACQLGNRVGYTPVPFLATLNGPDGAYETPCADGLHAYGQNNVCGGNVVLYTTAVHKDEADGSTKDEFVSEKSAALAGAENKTVTELKTDTWFGVRFPNHYGATRSAEAVTLAKAALER